MVIMKVTVWVWLWYVAIYSHPSGSGDDDIQYDRINTGMMLTLIRDDGDGGDGCGNEGGDICMDYRRTWKLLKK